MSPTSAGHQAVTNDQYHRWASKLNNIIRGRRIEKELISSSPLSPGLALSIHIGIHFFGQLAKESGIAWLSRPQLLWSSPSVKVSRVQGTAKDTRHRQVSQWLIVNCAFCFACFIKQRCCEARFLCAV